MVTHTFASESLLETDDAWRCVDVEPVIDMSWLAVIDTVLNVTVTAQVLVHRRHLQQCHITVNSILYNWCHIPVHAKCKML